jgi:hypothetical protein
LPKQSDREDAIGVLGGGFHPKGISENAGGAVGDGRYTLYLLEL